MEAFFYWSGVAAWIFAAYAFVFVRFVPFRQPKENLERRAAYREIYKS